MISPSGLVPVKTATKPGLPQGAEGLGGLKRGTIKSYLFSGAVYAFCPKRADRVKLV